MATPTPTSFYEGVRISRFSANPARVRGDGSERVELFLEVENVGDSPAGDVRATVFNYGDLRGIDTVPLGRLKPRDGEAPGGYTSFSFIFSVPARTLGIEDKVRPGVRVRFNYSSSARLDMVAIPREDWREGRLPAELPETGSSDGPVRLALEISKHPVIVSEDSGAFGIKLSLENAGRGRAWSERLGVDYIDRIWLEVPEGMELASPRNCDFEGELGESRVLVARNPGMRKLGQTRKVLICRFNVTNVGVESTYQFVAGADYRYQVDEFTTLTIVGTEPA